jgi:hypothetical protein
MTDTQRDGERTDSAQVSEGEGTMVVFGFTVPADEVAMASALKRSSEGIVEYERSVSTTHSPLPYLWNTDGTTPGFEQAVAVDPNIDRFTEIAEFEKRAPPDAVGRLKSAAPRVDDEQRRGYHPPGGGPRDGVDTELSLPSRGSALTDDRTCKHRCWWTATYHHR